VVRDPLGRGKRSAVSGEVGVKDAVINHILANIQVYRRGWDA
jgi:hypothetical protein